MSDQMKEIKDQMKKIIEVGFIYNTNLCKELVENASKIQEFDAEYVKVVKYVYAGDYDEDYIYTTENNCVYVTVHYYDELAYDDNILDKILAEIEKLALDLLEFPVDLLELPDKLKQYFLGRKNVIEMLKKKKKQE